MGFFSSLFGGNAIGNIFSAILGGFGAGEDMEEQIEGMKEIEGIKGEEERKSMSFADQLEYYRTQQRRHETSRALDSAYNQFSTVKQFAPTYVRGTGLDAMPAYPTLDEEEDD